MCFYKKTRESVAIKAHQDIFALKVLVKGKDKKLHSPHQTATWTIGKVKRCTKFDPKREGSLEVNEGLHCYRMLNMAFYAKGRYNLSKGVFVVMIPEGAMYYQNENEICANKMVVLSEITKFKVKKEVKRAKKK